MPSNPDPQEQLTAALSALTPAEVAAWTAWVETRLTERWSRRIARSAAAGLDEEEEPDPHG